MRRFFSSLSVISRGLERYKQASNLTVMQDLIGVKDPSKFDHFAWRTFRAAGGLKLVTPVLESEGYEPRDRYQFPGLMVTAQYFEKEDAPLIFVSELDDRLLPGDARAVLSGISPDQAWDGRSSGEELWGQRNVRDYETLQKYSQYAAWTYVHGNLLNHATINVTDTAHVSSVPGASIRNVMEHLKRYKVPLNAYGRVHISQDGLLHQASTQADDLWIAFDDDYHRRVPGVFVEFIERLMDSNGDYKKGFEAENATEIFTSTTSRHT